MQARKADGVEDDFVVSYVRLSYIGSEITATRSGDFCQALIEASSTATSWGVVMAGAVTGDRQAGRQAGRQVWMLAESGKVLQPGYLSIQGN